MTHCKHCNTLVNEKEQTYYHVGLLVGRILTKLECGHSILEKAIVDENLNKYKIKRTIEPELSEKAEEEAPIEEEKQEEVVEVVAILENARAGKSNKSRKERKLEKTTPIKKEYKPVDIGFKKRKK